MNDWLEAGYACLNFDLLVGLECFPCVATDALGTAAARNDPLPASHRKGRPIFLEYKFFCFDVRPYDV